MSLNAQKNIAKNNNNNIGTLIRDTKVNDDGTSTLYNYWWKLTEDIDFNISETFIGGITIPAGKTLTIKTGSILNMPKGIEENEGTYYLNMGKSEGNAKAKFILLSYNTTENKLNHRSNAKMSTGFIIKTLKKKGKLKIFEKDFNPFTTGKTNVNNHKERIYLVEVRK